MPVWSDADGSVHEDDDYPRCLECGIDLQATETRFCRLCTQRLGLFDDPTDQQDW